MLHIINCVGITMIGLYLALVFTDLGLWLERIWYRRKILSWKKVPNRNPDGSFNFIAPPIMDRLHLWRTRWFEVGIHHLQSADTMTLGLHDHPWDFWSIVLWGAYWEQYREPWFGGLKGFTDKIRRRGWLSSAFHKCTYQHAIIGVECSRRFRSWGCLTLVITSRRKHKWGFPEKGVIIG